jgi:hypothetical protein
VERFKKKFFFFFFFLQYDHLDILIIFNTGILYSNILNDTLHSFHMANTLNLILDLMLLALH